VAQDKIKNAKWPQPSSNFVGDTFRQGNKKQRYWLLIKMPNGKEEIEELAFDKWNKYPEKGKVQATKSLIFGFFKELKE
jgi:hypothetical protein